MISIRHSDHLVGESKITVTLNGEECGVFWFRESDTADARAARANTIGLLIGAVILEQVGR